MQTIELELPGLKTVMPDVQGDENGEFSYFHDEREYARLGLPAAFVQAHGSFYPKRWTVRGLHCQRAPHAQHKLVRVVRGRIFDVVVDVRRGSPTYGRGESVELSAANRKMLLVPIGFAHGFCTLEPDTEVVFRLTAYNHPASQSGIVWNDPALGIDWPCGNAPAWVFPFDRDLPRLADYVTGFNFP